MTSQVRCVVVEAGVDLHTHRKETTLTSISECTEGSPHNITAETGHRRRNWSNTCDWAEGIKTGPTPATGHRGRKLGIKTGPTPATGHRGRKLEQLSTGQLSEWKTPGRHGSSGGRQAYRQSRRQRLLGERRQVLASKKATTPQQGEKGLLGCSHQHTHSQASTPDEQSLQSEYPVC